MEMSKAITPGVPKMHRKSWALAGFAALLLLALLSVGAPSARAATRTLGTSGWNVISSADTPASGGSISSPGFAVPSSWLHVTPDDAGAPGTEVAALVQNH